MDDADNAPPPQHPPRDATAADAAAAAVTTGTAPEAHGDGDDAARGRERERERERQRRKIVATPDDPWPVRATHVSWSKHDTAVAFNTMLHSHTWDITERTRLQENRDRAPDDQFPSSFGRLAGKNRVCNYPGCDTALTATKEYVQGLARVISNLINGQVCPRIRDERVAAGRGGGNDGDAGDAGDAGNAGNAGNAGDVPPTNGPPTVIDTLPTDTAERRAPPRLRHAAPQRTQPPPVDGATQRDPLVTQHSAAASVHSASASAAPTPALPQTATSARSSVSKRPSDVANDPSYGCMLQFLASTFPQAAQLPNSSAGSGPTTVTPCPRLATHGLQPSTASTTTGKPSPALSGSVDLLRHAPISVLGVSTGMAASTSTPAPVSFDGNDGNDGHIHDQHLYHHYQQMLLQQQHALAVRTLEHGRGRDSGRDSGRADQRGDHGRQDEQTRDQTQRRSRSRSRSRSPSGSGSGNGRRTRTRTRTTPSRSRSRSSDRRRRRREDRSPSRRQDRASESRRFQQSQSDIRALLDLLRHQDARDLRVDHGYSRSRSRALSPSRSRAPSRDRTGDRSRSRARSRSRVRSRSRSPLLREDRSSSRQDHRRQARHGDDRGGRSGRDDYGGRYRRFDD